MVTPSSLSTLFFFSPLDQFSNASWLSTRTLESVSAYPTFLAAEHLTFADAATLYASTALTAEGSTFSTFLTHGINIPIASFAGPAILAILAFLNLNRYREETANGTRPAKSPNAFSHLTLLAVIYLLTGGFATAWFADLLFPVASLATPSTISYRLFPQIDLSLYLDETRVSLLLAFLLFGAGEEEADEDRLRATEADLTFAEDVVAPIYLTNLGTTVPETPALYLKVVALFSFIVINNLRGRLPYADTATSSLGLTLWISFASFASLLTLRFRHHGISYLFRFFRPSGTPLPLLLLLVPIEFLSYTFRLVSLSVRLFANRRAGHSLRKIRIGFAYVFLTLGDLYALAAFLPAIVVFVLVFLERAVAVIQAYIFTTLRARYRKDIYTAH